MSLACSTGRGMRAGEQQQQHHHHQQRCYRTRLTCAAAARRPEPETNAALLLTRRAAAAALLAAPLVAALAPAGRCAEEGITLVEEQAGSGTAEAGPGDLVMLHYEGTLDGTSTVSGSPALPPLLALARPQPSSTFCVSLQVFDSTLGGAGLSYRDGGAGVLRPLIYRLGGGPQPGVCAGLEAGIRGMRVGGQRTFTVPPLLGFGAGQVLAPYAPVPGGSTLRYTVRLLRLSRVGPDALLSGTSQCGGGAVMERTQGCADIGVAEFL